MKPTQVRLSPEQSTLATFYNWVVDELLLMWKPGPAVEVAQKSFFCIMEWIFACFVHTSLIITLLFMLLVPYISWCPRSAARGANKSRIKWNIFRVISFYLYPIDFCLRQTQLRASGIGLTVKSLSSPSPPTICNLCSFQKKHFELFRTFFNMPNCHILGIANSAILE
jgi:hypothetical protein